MNMSQKKTEKSGQKKRGFSALFGKSSLEFGRLYPNIDETTTKNSTKERDYWKEKVEAQLEGKPFVENERYERRKHKITRISRPQ